MTLRFCRSIRVEGCLNSYPSTFSVDETPHAPTVKASFGTGTILFDQQWLLAREVGKESFMAQKGRKGSGGKQGFASMDDDRKRTIASQGGLASAKASNTSNRGFASMDKDKRREISSMGGKASRSTQNRPEEKNEEDAERKDITREKDATVRDLSTLEGTVNDDSSETQGDLAYSETDEDEDEGLGDGNLGRSTRGGVDGK